MLEILGWGVALIMQTREKDQSQLHCQIHKQPHRDNCTHLGSCYVGNSQLSLVVQHLLKVRNMPGGVCGVTMKTLR